MSRDLEFRARGWIACGVGIALIAGCSSTTQVPVVERGASPAPRQPAAEPREQRAGSYVVKKGDTLFSIAQSHGVDVRELAAWNGMDNPHRLEVGMALRMAPAEGSATARPVAAPASVEARPLGPAGVAAPPMAAAAPDGVKKDPKGGKQPYSDQALTQVQKAGDAARKPPELALAPPASFPESVRREPAQAESGEAQVEWSWPVVGKVLVGFNDGSTKGIDIGGQAGESVLAAAGGKVVYAGSGLRGYGNLVIIKHNPALLSAYAHNRRLLVKEGENVTRGQKIAELGSSDADQTKLHFEIRNQGKPVDPLKYLPPRQQ
ncbi:MAG: peptidoglycan DD-metalloendopeptidase family protein [Betaproteobacteria bacterium]|nr:peptidoglycan DD-metalloendopeptidase family protein [Betaproteobacteria bacterium]